uniref:BHLH domain-containing protein n=1 Tax=Strongyloides venezuelensis TaxID=75913 RepID=A0A0K0EYG5_STRVS
MASRQFEDAFKNVPNRYVPQRPKFVDSNRYNNYPEQYVISGNENDRRYYSRPSSYNDSHVNEEYHRSQTRSPYPQQFRRIVVPSNSQQQTFTEIGDRKRPRMEYYYRGNESQQQHPIPQIQRNYPIKRPCFDPRVNPPTTSVNQNTKPPVVLRPITRVSKPQYPPHKVIQRYVDRHPNTIIMRGPNITYGGNNLNLQQTLVKPRNSRDDGYVNKLKLIKKNCRNIIFMNAAMVDEISRVNFVIQTITEEVQMLAKKVQHLERNKLRRYQQLLKREALIDCKEKNDSDKIVPSHEIDVYYDNKTLDKSNNEEVSDMEGMNITIPEDQNISDMDVIQYENHGDESNDVFPNYDMDNDMLLRNEQLSAENEYYQNPFGQYTNEHSIIL